MWKILETWNLEFGKIRTLGYGKQENLKVEQLKY